MVNLRQKINESKLGKLINESSLGRSFEISPFAFAVEGIIQTNQSIYRQGDILNSSRALVGSPLFFPLLWYDNRGMKKSDKEKYEIFALDSLAKVSPSYK